MILDAIADDAFHPRGEPLVQESPLLLGQALVGGITDQEMAEAKRVFTWQGASPGRISSLRTSASRCAPTSGRISSGVSSATAPRWKHLPLDRGALDDLPLSQLESVEASGEQRMDRRRHFQLLDGTVMLGDHRQHLLDEERVPFGRIDDSPANPLVDGNGSHQIGDELLALRLAERLEQHCRRVQLASTPSRADVEQFCTRNAEQKNRCIAAPVGDVLDQIKERRLRPVQVIKHQNKRTLTGSTLEPVRIDQNVSSELGCARAARARPPHPPAGRPRQAASR